MGTPASTYTTAQIDITRQMTPKVKMTEKEFYEKLDHSIESARAGHVIKQQDGESEDQFIDRLLCIE